MTATREDRPLLASGTVPGRPERRSINFGDHTYAVRFGRFSNLHRRREVFVCGAIVVVVLALGIGALVSFGLASLLKRRTFGLELDEIARLLQEREATLHGIREGVIAIDPAGRITVVNDEAQRLLHLRR